MANRSWKLCALVLFLAVPSLPLRAGNVPVLARAGSGRLILERGAVGGQSEVRRHLKILPFDRASKKGPIRKAARLRALLGAAAAPDTIRVMLIRVSFESDRDDALSSLSTGGGFDLAPNGNALIDPAPHGRSYFDAHMQALGNYFRFQSCGRLEIVADVLPEDENGSYLLSDLADYGPGESGSWRVENLVRFFRDAVRAADDALAGQGYPKRFGDYDAVVVAHAGANLQSDVVADTPNDVPSFFASLGSEDTFTVDGGATTIREGAVIPETASQDGFNGGIAGVLAHEFGHQLGLPDLYNATAGTPAVGYWDLMDSGGYLGAYIRDGEGRLQYAEGFLPGGLSAWCRTFLGWTAVDTVATFENAITLPAVEKCPARVVRVEAASDEYFLVENRAAELDGIATEYVVAENGVILGTANATGGGSPGAPAALVNGYDLLLPRQFIAPSPNGGPGLLVWHVDERLIAERWDGNVLNADRPFAISLLEANGVVDLGDASSRFALGWYDDAYYAGNQTVLSDSTLPAAWSTWRVPTGVRIDHVSARDTLMSFNARVKDVFDSKKLADREGATEVGSLILPDGNLLVVDARGRGWIAGREGPVFSVGRPFVTIPAFASSFSTLEASAVIIGDRDGYVHAFRYGQWGEFDGWPAHIAGSFIWHPVVVRHYTEDFVAVTDRSGRVHLLGGDGREEPGSPFILPNHVVSNMAVATGPVGEAEGLFVLAGDAEPVPRAWLFRLDHSPELRPSSGYPVRLLLSAKDMEDGVYIAGGDVNPDEEGDEVFVLCRATGRIMLVGPHGVLSERRRERSIVAPPALRDLNGDSYLDLVYSDGISIYAINPSGANLTGWPRSLDSFRELPGETRFRAPATILASGKGVTVVTGSDAGLLYLVKGSGESAEGYPRKASHSILGPVEIWNALDGSYFVYRDGSFAKWRSAPDGPGRWVSLWGNSGRTAWTVRSSASGSPAEWLELSKDFVIYPNPSKGDRIGFHFVAPQEGTARLEILTLTGERVLERDKRLAGGEDEFVVSMKGKASGVYLSRLVITSGGRRVEANRKFAIVR